MVKRAKSLRYALRRIGQINLNTVDITQAGSWSLAGQRWVWLLIFLSTGFVGSLFYILPPLNTLKQTQALQDQLLEAFRVQVQQEADLIMMEQQVVLLQQTLQSLSTALPDHSALPELIEDISELVSQHEVNLLKLERQPEQIAAQLNALPLILTLQGHYHELAFFLAALLRQERLITLHDFTLHPEQHQLQLTIEAKAYYRNPVPQLTTQETKDD